MQEDGMRPGRARSLASSLTTVAPEEETFWALQGLSVMGRCGWQGCQPVKGEHCPTLRISGACAPPTNNKRASSNAEIARKRDTWKKKACQDVEATRASCMLMHIAFTSDGTCFPMEPHADTHHE
jgi:hypothetical protein